MDRRFRVVTRFGTTVLALISIWIVVSLISSKSWLPHNGTKVELADDSMEPAWPQFRGPTFDAVSSEVDLADSWPDDGPPLVWTRELGEGYSSFSAVGQHVFTQYQTLTQQLVACLDAETGQTVWTHSYAWPYEGGGLYPGPRSTPTWHSGNIYFAAPDGTVSCLNAKSGSPIWSINPKKKFRGKGTDFGYACSPVVIDGKVIVPVGGLDASVVALDVSTGSVIWGAGSSPASYATPLPISLNGKLRIVAPLENSIAAFEIDSGNLMWEIEYSQGYDEHSAAPIYSEPFLFFASPFQAGAKCYKLFEHADETSMSGGTIKSDKELKATSELSLEKSEEPVGASSDFVTPDTGRNLSDTRPANLKQSKWDAKQLVWESQRLSNDVCSSVLFEGRLYGFDLKDPQSRMNRPSRGEFRCLDFLTGQVIWSTDRVGQCNIIIADRKLILFTDRGELILARPGTNEYTELARATIFNDEVCWTSPALHRGRIYLRTQQRAACLDLRNPSTRSSKPTGRVKDIPRGRLLDAAVLIGGEREFPATIPSHTEFLVWYRWSLASLGLAWIVSLAAWAVLQCFRWSGWRWTVRRHPLSADASLENLPSDRSVGIARLTFWLVVSIVGMIGSPMINARQNEYVLLWPLLLWAAFQMTINVIVWTERQSNRRSFRWLSRVSVGLFIGICVTYFLLCRGLGYAIEWSFLFGFLPGFIFAALAGRWLTARSRTWPATDMLFCMLSWTAYFWSCVLFVNWRLTVGS